ncbi:M28 family peptidase [Archangium gephyra]|uniref:M28 family peptidase n=1 Tax=Archangium gephyra TaxID=48 RepID=UPI003B7FCB1B
MVKDRVPRALGLLGAVLAVALGVVRAGWPVAPVPADAPPGSFSEARAMEALTSLTALGPRPAFSPAAHRAADLLAERLARIPGVKVERQDIEGTLDGVGEPGTVTLYRVRNVLARLEGTEPGAVLLSAHYDSAAEGPGAGDDGLGVAAAVEVMRALASQAPLRHPVVLNLSGAEETGVLGADGFLEHPWAREVKAFINLEAAGSSGRAILFRASASQGAPLVEAYARAVPFPAATVLGQDLLGGGLTPFFTDFERYTAAGLPGLDQAPIEGGYTYHTALDRPERLGRGTLQHLGANTLALVRELANGPLESPGDSGSVIFFDVAGLGMVVYGRSTAVGLAVLSVVLTAVACALAVRRGALSVRELGTGLLGVGWGTLLGLLLPAVVALGLGVGAGRPHGWYAWPALGVVTFGVLSFAGVLLGDALWARLHHRRGGTPERRAFQRWAGVALGACAVLGVSTWSGLGVSYLPAFWSLGAALGFLSVLLVPRWQGAALVLSFLPGALLSAQACSLLLSLFIPMTGHLYAAVPLDAVLALLVALPVAAGASLGTLALPWESWRWKGTGPLLALGLAGALALALVPPATAERPRRLRAVLRDTPEGRHLSLFSLDGLGLGDAVPGLTPAQRVEAEVRRTPLETDVLEGPRLEVLRRTESDGAREVSVRIHAPAQSEVRLEVPVSALIGWSLGDTLPRTQEGMSTYRAFAFEVPARGWEVTLRLRGSEPIPVRVTAHQEGAVLPELVRLRDSLPAESTGSFAASSTRVESL